MVRKVSFVIVFGMFLFVGIVCAQTNSTNEEVSEIVFTQAGEVLVDTIKTNQYFLFKPHNAITAWEFYDGNELRKLVTATPANLNLSEFKTDKNYIYIVAYGREIVDIRTRIEENLGVSTVDFTQYFTVFLVTFSEEQKNGTAYIYKVDRPKYHPWYGKTPCYIMMNGERVFVADSLSAMNEFEEVDEIDWEALDEDE